TNRDATADQYRTSGSPHFAKSALARFTPADFLARVEKHGIAWHEKKLGQLFCDQSSRQIVELLESECAAGGVDLRRNCREISVRRPGSPEDASSGFEITSSLGAFHARSLVVATGGLSFPKLGATPFGYELARQFGLRVVPPRPGLVPLIPGGDMAAALAELAGISLDCEAQAGPHTPLFREHLLFTHRGLSGPVILQVSNYLQSGEPLRVNLMPGQTALSFLTGRSRGAQTVRQALRGVWPDRFLQRWSGRHATERPLAQWARRDLEALAGRIESWTLPIVGDEGYPKAEVTLGGVDTGELSSKTLESRRVPGLHFIGEVVDVTGWLGGYNFQWAWSSAHAAGQAV
ncbi:MAG: aminoacetone oxidase family FAD-binding enzyme, partial [Verrucomicrobiae bacterium]|nr:aminoacetone oxidase family FAD-binding enzyme [Verrucomicrobiae bacterium]